MSAREEALEGALNDALAMLRDLHENFGWDSLHCSLEDLEARAQELQVGLEESTTENDVAVALIAQDGTRLKEGLMSTMSKCITEADVLEVAIWRTHDPEDVVRLVPSAWNRIIEVGLLSEQDIVQEHSSGVQMEEALRVHIDVFENHYTHCGQSWQDVWNGACNDDCPVCGAEIEPIAEEERVLRRLIERDDGRFELFELVEHN